MDRLKCNCLYCLVIFLQVSIKTATKILKISLGGILTRTLTTKPKAFEGLIDAITSFSSKSNDSWNGSDIDWQNLIV